ncbi:MAG: DoxX family protein [Elusimicrobia bacterium]|nr:DoxX family protein [Elusimicrobiota bacterium]
MTAPAGARPVFLALGVAARLIVGGVLVYAGASKAAGAAEEFALVIGAYQVLPPEMNLTLATFLPWVELIVGWSLILGLRLHAAAVASCALFAAFLAALLSVQVRGIELPTCGCFGDSLHFTTLQALLFDSALAGLSFLAWKSAPAPLSLDSWTQGGYTGDL